MEYIFLGVVMCPNFKGEDFFKVGKLYELELKKCFEEDECKVDEKYKNSVFSIYVVEKVEII